MGKDDSANMLSLYIIRPSSKSRGSVIPGHLHVDFEEVSLGFPASLAGFPGGPWARRSRRGCAVRKRFSQLQEIVSC